MSKKGVSPVVATVLLISIVLVIGLIIFLWARGFVAEEGTKFGKNVKLVCEEISFKASYSGGNLNIINEGNVPIFRVKVKILQGAGYSTKDITDLSSSWPDVGLNQGESFSGSIGSEVSGAEKIKIIPVLLAETNKGERVYTCDEQFGYEFEL
jgi:FlaG/FlaF family flagellin (archaellin)